MVPETIPTSSSPKTQKSSSPRHVSRIALPVSHATCGNEAAKVLPSTATRQSRASAPSTYSSPRFSAVARFATDNAPARTGRSSVWRSIDPGLTPDQPVPGESVQADDPILTAPYWPKRSLRTTWAVQETSEPGRLPGRLTVRTARASTLADRSNSRRPVAAVGNTLLQPGGVMAADPTAAGPTVVGPNLECAAGWVLRAASAARLTPAKTPPLTEVATTANAIEAARRRLPMPTSGMSWRLMPSPAKRLVASSARAQG